ncbi:MAG: hypothetical protein ACK41D_09800 [Rubricoccaceae bacterium]
MELITEDQVVRVLEWYEKDPGEQLVGEEELVDVSLDALREALRADDPEDPALLLPYEVEPEDVPALQALVRHCIDLGAHDYFVAAYRR